jgi:hypothetical protein
VLSLWVEEPDLIVEDQILEVLQSNSSQAGQGAGVSADSMEVDKETSF